MQDRDTIHHRAGRSPWAAIRRGPVAAAAAGALVVGLAAGALVPQTAPFALAQTEAAPTVQTPQGAAPLSFAGIVKKVKPAVVSIHVKNGRERPSVSREFRGLPDLPDDHPLNEFFRRFMPDGMPGAPGTPERRPRPSMAQGSGFFISPDGYLVTNNHVIANASDITIRFDDGTEMKAEPVGADSRTDLALLKVQGDREFPYIEFATTPAEVGDWVLAVGNPFGLGGTVTAGIVSAHNRDIGSSPYDYLQIDAAVNRGNSGGPAINLEGKVVGVNTAIFSPSGGNVGIAFAVPAELAATVIEQLKEHGKVARGWLGVTIQNVTPELAASVGLDEAHGAMITSLAEKGPAINSELRPGDVIVAVNGERVEDSRDLARKIAGLKPETQVSLDVVRDGQRQTVAITLGQFPANPELAAARPEVAPVPGKSEEMKDLGMSLTAGEQGVVITEVDPDSEAAEKGLRSGDIIVEVAGSPVSTPGDVAEGVQKAREKGRTAVLMRIRSGDQHRFVALPINKT